MCDRAPDGVVEIVDNCFRIIQSNNWKLFLENELDAVHATITHISAAKAASDVEEEIKKKPARFAVFLQYLSALTTPMSRREQLETPRIHMGIAC